MNPAVREELAVAPLRRDPSKGTVLAMLAGRSLMFVGIQGFLALAYSVLGDDDPWRAAADWWLVAVTITNLVFVVLLTRLAHREGLNLRDVYHLDRSGLKGDLGWLLVAFLVAGPVAYLPNILLGAALWGDPSVGADLSFRALPLAAVWFLIIVFPVSQGLAELPTYFGYVMPRLARYTQRSWTPPVMAASALSVQHIFLPLLFDWRFLLWRLLMFVPFAFWMGYVIRRRPTVLPYLMAGHALLDLSLPLLILQASS